MINIARKHEKLGKMYRIHFGMLHCCCSIQNIQNNDGDEKIIIKYRLYDGLTFFLHIFSISVSSLLSMTARINITLVHHQ